MFPEFLGTNSVNDTNRMECTSSGVEGDLEQVLVMLAPLRRSAALILAKGVVSAGEAGSGVRGGLGTSTRGHHCWDDWRG